MLASLTSVMKTATLTLPVMEVSLLLIALTCCLVFRLPKIGIIAAYVFVYRWGWMVVVPLGQNAFVAYMIFGVIVGALTVVSMLRPSSSDD